MVASDESTDKPRDKFSSRVILTTYPGQSNVNPFPLNWGATDPLERGPIIVSRQESTLSSRNAIGAHGGSYSVYFALANATNQMPFNHKPDFTNTEPPVDFKAQPTWSDPEAIASMDPFGHQVQTVYKDLMAGKVGLDIRPTISITRAKLSLIEMELAVKAGRLVPDGKVVLNDKGEMAVTKVAVDPVWYLPQIAKRFGVTEQILRRSLFEYTGGMYPELITRPDMKVFLPPIGGLTVYIFGDPAKVSDASVRLACRVHDECNGSDVFSSDICTCRPYLLYGIEECAKEAQNGGSGLVIYFRKEGRALGEVLKYLVYNLRKREGDSADKYFSATERIAGVKDMRFQALMPDILCWLGVKKIDKMLSMSNMKYDAIVSAGIPIHERVELPDHLIPEDSKVEIEAKINSGYFSSRTVTAEDLTKVKGRGWAEPDQAVSLSNVFEDQDH
ncbi:GTP cyclohydrolase II [Protomyces lactucae-debilis]|uniref:GTP cyclohydrolase II n=1 Tax=Protomyces lactucae-debilis TaxID=2754530 RepID=A0A1Y2F302_PROLT|nr:GTP cyclohydrolase II [Protomyces lactucae-debilis]ORY78249.1 GTP cyclohydrolase II [Protomyces lactucae-debilis]